MSSMLDQAIIDATALREAAIKSAEQAVVEKYSTEIKEAVEQLMEENDFEENKTVDEQIVEADEKGKGYAFVEDTELSDLEQNDLVDIDVKALFEEVQQEQLQEEVEIDDELLEEDVEISDELIGQLVEEIMSEGGKVQQAKELSDDDEAGDDDIKVKSVSKVVIVKDDDEMEMEEKEEALEEEIKMDYTPAPVGQTTAYGATRAQQAEQAMLMDVMLALSLIHI